jgi:thimet oligopeptidase
MARQLSLGLVDLSLHSARPPTDINAAALKIYRNKTGIDLVSGSLFPASFGHLNGYSAAYYSYNWALRYNYDLESHFLKEGFMNPETWTRYLDIILSAGDTAAAPELLEKFLGRKPNSRAFNKRLRDTSCIDPLLKLI